MESGGCGGEAHVTVGGLRPDRRKELRDLAMKFEERIGRSGGLEEFFLECVAFPPRHHAEATVDLGKKGFKEILFLEARGQEKEGTDGVALALKVFGGRRAV